jgi:chemotaxis signal transduction protein
MNAEGQHCIGFLVDAIGCVTTVSRDQLRTLPDHAHGVPGRYLEGVLESESDLIAVLNTAELYGDLQPVQSRAATGK